MMLERNDQNDHKIYSSEKDYIHAFNFDNYDKIQTVCFVEFCIIHNSVTR